MGRPSTLAIGSRPWTLAPCDTHAAPWLRGLHELHTRRAMTALKVIHESIISQEVRANEYGMVKEMALTPPGRTIQPRGISTKLRIRNWITRYTSKRSKKEGLEENAALDRQET
jgi:hypothetical protein